ncbi:DNA-binding HxlR family transcriptional regulator [Paenibacillus sp. V4I3]|uniref:winged helix-turn-helix transcriptional regulator n=1 Tax=Paenibacillus sp. V4I3 TaxID=3042305 RepID=UPI00277D50B6|nr:helix-turn-helix domain-containing protein [Paenibacillus sp. V4I3]MDQ0876115.1 DNA-binding HxlR family transcriptional regulator [Paenibacillus sp. V4I3]
MQVNPIDCKMSVALDMIVGKWKPIIIQHLIHRETLRFNEIKNLIPDISHRILTLQLRELEEQDIIQRVIYPQVPPKVEYSLTAHGKKLEALMDSLHYWGLSHLKHMEEKEKNDIIGNQA